MQTDPNSSPHNPAGTHEKPCFARLLPHTETRRDDSNIDTSSLPKTGKRIKHQGQTETCQRLREAAAGRRVGGGAQKFKDQRAWWGAEA